MPAFPSAPGSAGVKPPAVECIALPTACPARRNQSLRSPAKPAVAPATNAPKASAEHATEHKKTVLVNGKKEKKEDAKVLHGSGERGLGIFR